LSDDLLKDGKHPDMRLSLDDLSIPHGLTRAELMTSHEVAELVGVPVSTVREWGRKGTLPRVKLGRHVRYVRSHVEAAILGAEERHGQDGAT
jgi:excisionase family DNA binding protein